MERKLLSAQTILPISSKPIYNSSVYLQNGKIAEIGPTDSLLKKYKNVKLVS